MSMNDPILGEVQQTGDPRAQVSKPTPSMITPKFKDKKFSDPVAFYSSTANMRMHRWDGGEINFTHHYFQTVLSGDIDYLEYEIENGNQFIRPATEDEVRNAQFRIDPKGAMKKELLNDPDVMEELRQKWENERGGKGIQGVDSPELTPGNTVKTDGATIHMEETKSNETPSAEPARRTAAEIAEEIKARQAANVRTDLGNSTEGKFTPGSTANMPDGGAGPAAASSVGAGSAGPVAK